MPVMNPAVMTAIANLTKEKRDIENARPSNFENIAKLIQTITGAVGDIQEKKRTVQKEKRGQEFDLYKEYIKDKTLYVKDETAKSERPASDEEIQFVNQNVIKNLWQIPKGQKPTDPRLPIKNPNDPNKMYIWQPKTTTIKPKLFVYQEPGTDKMTLDGKPVTAVDLAKYSSQGYDVEVRGQGQVSAAEKPRVSSEAMVSFINNGYYFDKDGKAITIENQEDADHAAKVNNFKTEDDANIKAAIQKWPTEQQIKDLIDPKIKLVIGDKDSKIPTQEKLDTIKKELRKKLTKGFRDDPTKFTDKLETPKPTAKERFNQLIGEGMTEDRAYEILKTEGY